MNIGEIIKELRIERGMTQKQLAELLFTSQDTISLWECGKSFPDILMVVKLTKIFHVSADYLLCIEN